jgi:hypothetical protein
MSKWFHVQVKVIDDKLGFVKASGDLSWTLPSLLRCSDDKLQYICPLYWQFKQRWSEQAEGWTCKRSGYKQQGCPFDCEDVFTACYSNNLAYLELYLLAGGRRDSQQAGKTLLHYAAAGDSPDCIRLLIEQRVDLDCADLSGNTPIALAVQANALESLRLLIFEGARVDGGSSEGNLLHIAATHNAIPSAVILVFAGVSLTQPNAKGLTPLDIASKAGLLDFEIAVQQASKSLFYSTCTRKEQPPMSSLEPVTADTSRQRKTSLIDWIKSFRS